MTYRVVWLVFCLPCLLFGIDTLKPTLSCTLSQEYLKNMTPSPLSISYTEKGPEWAKEYFLGTQFAKDGDFYRALTALKRCAYLAKDASVEARFQIDYAILACYYFAMRHDDVIRFFEDSTSFTTLSSTQNFELPLMAMLYESYLVKKADTKAERIRSLLSQNYKKQADTLLHYKNIFQANLPILEKRAREKKDEQLAFFLESYTKQRKNPRTAGILNALLPGAGYFYVGQRQSAITSLCINALFIWATVELWRAHLIAPALITLSFETGWYVGGIRGSYLAAQEYNSKLYSKLASRYAKETKVFPIFMVEYAF